MMIMIKTFLKRVQIPSLAYMNFTSKWKQKHHKKKYFFQSYAFNNKEKGYCGGKKNPASYCFDAIIRKRK